MAMGPRRKIYHFTCTMCGEEYMVDIRKATYPGYSSLCSNCAENKLLTYQQKTGALTHLGFPRCRRCGGQVVGNSCLQCGQPVEEISLAESYNKRR